MANMELISNYKDDGELRGQLNALTREIFGFHFEEWYQRGFWDDRYVCYSFFEHGQIVSNVSATAFDLVIHNKVFRAIQLGAVMTKQAWRGHGLSIELTNKILETYQLDCDFFYLFGHRGVWDYYAKQQFLPIREWSYSVELIRRYEATGTLRRLDISKIHDLDIIRRLTQTRVPVSKACGVLHDTSVFLFYCINMYSENLFYSDAYDCLLVFSIEQKVLQLYDVLCESELGFTDIMTLISSEFHEIQRVDFHYTPQYSDMSIPPCERVSDDRMFFKGEPSVLPSYFVYPAIAQT